MSLQSGSLTPEPGQVVQPSVCCRTAILKLPCGGCVWLEANSISVQHSFATLARPNHVLSGFTA
eukprot:1616858-Amphidinium_carterae.1